MERDYTEITEREYYETPSIYLTSALIIKEFVPEDIQPGLKTIFRFKWSLSLEKTIAEYHSGKLIVPADKFATTLLNLKNLIYSRKNNPQNRNESQIAK
jgi:hypothetical protein